MQGQIYVEVLAPKEQRRPYPLVLIHGAAQTATNWMGTPDGREGWAEYFVEQGYVVYMIDQPMRGRSAYHPGDGATRMFTTENEEFQFTAIETNGTWPGREKHTQWPGSGANKGKQGDPVFDAFYATQVETVMSPERDGTAQSGRRRSAARQDRSRDRADAFAVRRRSAGSLPTPGRSSSKASSRSSRPGRRSKRPSSAPARRGPGDRPISRSLTIRRRRIRARSPWSATRNPTARTGFSAGCRRRRRGSL